MGRFLVGGMFEQDMALKPVELYRQVERAMMGTEELGVISLE